MRDGDDILQVLDRLSAQALALDAADKDAIAQIGSALEGLLEGGGVSEEVSALLGLALQALQGIYEESLPADAVDAVACAIASARENLTGPAERPSAPSLRQAMEQLEAVLGGGAVEAREDSSQPASTEPPASVTEVPQAQLEPVPAPQPAAPVAGASAASAQVFFAAPAILPADTDMDLLKEFVVECLDHIAAAESSLLDLEAQPENSELINTIFRAFHTIKGTSGFLGLDRVQKLAHLAENLLNRGRDGVIQIRGGYADLALKSCDALRTMIEGLSGAQAGQELNIPASLEDLLGCLSDPEAHGVSDEAHATSLRLGDLVVAQGAERTAVEAAAAGADGQKIGQALIESGAASAQDVGSALRIQKKLDGGDSDATIRVSTNRLDSLINMVGELVIAQSMVAQDHTVRGVAELGRKVSHADKIVRELQDLTMSLRMVPLRVTFQKMARLVRDLARKSSKSVQFVCEGEGTEIDRSMVEVLGDPLVHMIRNCVDHGIESEQDRAKSGKNPTGTVTLRAYHAGGKVVIELIDDGRGLNRDKILAKAIDKGLLQAGREIPDGEIFAQIFRPGFSTADKITDISGRGVGMDVVKRGIEALRGQVDVSSTPGQGTRFTLRLPLTMAISDAMLVQVGQERYLLPTIAIEHSFRPAPGAVVSVAGGKGEMVQLRGQLLPVLRLHKIFGVRGARTNPAQALMIVLEGRGRRCALMVDELLAQQQVVIKTLGCMFANTAGIAGGAILGDGRVGLILDAPSLVELGAQSDAQAA